MAVYTLYALAEDQLTISGDAQLSGFDQGDASQLMGQTITLNSNSWETIDVDDSDANFNDSDSSQTLAGAQTVFGVSYASGLRVEAEYTLTVEDSDGNEYTLIGFNINEAGSEFPSYGTVEGLAFIGTFPPRNEPLTVTATAEGPGGSTTPYGSYAEPPCFVSGTGILTPKGTVLVEDLRQGDEVMTSDHGAQSLVWTGQVELDPDVLTARPGLRPIRFRKDAFGPGVPGRDLCVSPQHRILLRGWRANLIAGEPEILVAAKHLVNRTTILRDHGMTSIAYHHVMCASHEIIFADGLATEAFRPGPESVPALDPDARSELLALFPALKSGQEMAPVRPLADRREALVLAP